ncbi:MAG: hypothetical protein IPO07_11340 [Haliscomenobacter sp.]|nr:hypothetical protein [Haliscomenobacter sp.]MBK9489308.1 hypothetical protein [Haliscomenobacter sp.]
MEQCSGQNIVWRSRSKDALPLLKEMIQDPQVRPFDLRQYFRALHFQTDPLRNGLPMEAWPCCCNNSRADDAKAQQILYALAPVNNLGLFKVYQQYLSDANNSLAVRRAALNCLNSTWDGQIYLLALFEKNRCRKNWPCKVWYPWRVPGTPMSVKIPRNVDAKTKGNGQGPACGGGFGRPQRQSGFR